VIWRRVSATLLRREILLLRDVNKKREKAFRVAPTYC